MQIPDISVSEILKKLQSFEDEIGRVSSKGETSKSVNLIRSVFDATPNALSWINIGRPDQQQLLNETKAGVLVVGMETNSCCPEQTLLMCENPKLVFSIIVSIWCREKVSGIHPSSIINPKAKIGENVTIGANCVIGEAEILENTFISDSCSLQWCTRRENVTIGSGTNWLDRIRLCHLQIRLKIQFPLGGVIIEDDRIGANSC